MEAGEEEEDPQVRRQARRLRARPDRLVVQAAVDLGAVAVPVEVQPGNACQQVASVLRIC